MSDIYAPVMRALVVGALVLATATLMFVTVNTARARPALPWFAPCMRRRHRRCRRPRNGQPPPPAS